MHRPDTITVADEGQRFTPHPEGQFAAVCVDVIDLGRVVKSYPGSKSYVAKELALVFWTGEVNEEGEPHEVSAKMTVSMGSKANLRAFLEAWRGKSYTDDEAKAGVPLHKLVGHAALLSVEHKTSAKGRTYAKIKAVSPLPKAMPKPDLPEYTRPPFWLEVMEANAAAVNVFLRTDDQPKAKTKPVDTDFDDFPEALDAEDDDLPF